MIRFTTHKTALCILLITLLSTYISCTKEEVVITDTRPLEIETLAIGNVKATEVTLYGEITHLNNEKIIDHGFVLVTVETDEKITLSIKETAKPGQVSFNYKPTVPFKMNGYYSYYYYVQTDKQTYVGKTGHFMVNDIWVSGSNELAASPGESVTIQGSFKQIDNGFRLYLNYPVDKDVVYTVSEDGTSLTFTVPTNISSTGEAASLYLSQNNQMNTIQLATLQVLGKLHPPAAGQHYFTDPIRLTGDGLPPAYYTTSFKVIIGNRVLDYQSTYFPNELRLTGDSYRIGYYNGRDTIIFDEPWKLIHPDPNNIGFSSTVVHPGTQTNIVGIDFYKFFEYQFSQTLIGDVPVFSAAMFNTFERQVYVPNLPNGKYPVTLKSDIYPPMSSKETLEIRALKVNGVDGGNGYFDNPVVVTGNFLPNQEYTIRCCNDTDVYFGEAQDGKLIFNLPFYLPLGKNQLSIGYKSDQFNFFVADETFSLQVNGATIESFYPTSGRPGDIITVKGKGLQNAYYLSMAGADATILSRTESECQIMVPVTLRKGLSKITLDIAGNFFQSKDYFTVL